MRTDENGVPCPGTLGEYLKLCKAAGLPNNKAVEFLNKKIESSTNGENEEVIAPDSQMRMLLMPLLIQQAT